MANKKRLITFPYDTGYKGNSTSRFASAAKGGDNILEFGGEWYDKTITLPKEGGGIHSLESSSAGTIYNLFSGAFDRNITGNPETELFFDVYSKSNNSCWNKAWSLGDANFTSASGTDINSSWMYDVTGYWGMIRGNNNSSERDCSGQLNQLYGAYMKPNGNRAYIPFSTKVGDYSYGDKMYTNTADKMFGYTASSSDRTAIINGKWRFWRLYVCVAVCRNGGSTKQDRCTVSLFGFTPQFGTDTRSWNGSHTRKKVLVTKPDTWLEYQKVNRKVLFRHH